MVTGRYGGGGILDGWLAGTLQGGVLSFNYVQVEVSGTVDAGVSAGALSRLPDGRLQLVEKFTWRSRRGEGTNRLEQLAVNEFG